MSRTLPRPAPAGIAVFLLFFFSSAASVQAQEQLASNVIVAPTALLPDALARATLFPATPPSASAEAAVSASQPLSMPPAAREFGGTRRPAVLPALYATTVVLEALDAHSTMTGLRLGATEANPLMKGAVGSPVTLLAVKAGAAAGTIYFAEKLWKRNRVAAVVLVAAVNGVTAAVVAHNYRVAARLR